jgi:predicted acetyltransferase
MTAVSIRPARPDDLDRVLAIHANAYPDERGDAARLRYLTSPPLGEPSDLWVAERGGAVVGHAFLFALQGWFGGRTVPIGGVASVGVAPEARGRGLASRILEHLHGLALDRGAAVCVLYPFRQGFYRRFGYGVTSAVHHLRFAPGALARLRRELEVERASGEDRAAMAECRERVGRSGTGVLVRTERTWQLLLGEERRVWLVARREGEVEGYVCWTVEQPAAFGPATLTVRELAAASPAAWRSLWSAVGAQRDQVDEVRADVAADDPLDRVLVDADRGRRGDAWVPHDVGFLSNGPMVRIVDVPRALAARGWAGEGRVLLDVDGDRFELDVTGGNATVTPRDGVPELTADLTIDLASLSSIAFGGIELAQALRGGWATARDAGSAARAAALFSLPPYFSSDGF